MVAQQVIDIRPTHPIVVVPTPIVRPTINTFKGANNIFGEIAPLLLNTRHRRTTEWHITNRGGELFATRYAGNRYDAQLGLAYRPGKEQEPAQLVAIRSYRSEVWDGELERLVPDRWSELTVDKLAQSFCVPVAGQGRGKIHVEATATWDTNGKLVRLECRPSDRNSAACERANYDDGLNSFEHFERNPRQIPDFLAPTGWTTAPIDFGQRAGVILHSFAKFAYAMTSGG